MTTFPVVDALLWARWLGATIVVIWLPGHLLIGRWMRGSDRLARILLSSAAGLLLVPLIGTAFGLLGLALAPMTYLPTACVLGWWVARARAHRDLVQSVGLALPSLDRRSGAVVHVSIVLSVVLVVAGLHDFVAPPHVHDASNHAYLTLRVAETSTMDPRALVAEDVGRPAVLYLVGWHAAAALIARTASIAPYLGTWMTALAALVLVPASLTLLWRSWGLPPLAIGVGSLLVAVNQLVPSGLHGWGGFGQILGFFLVPPLAIAACAVLARPGWRSAILFGLGCGALVHVHASEVAVLVLLGPAIAMAVQRGPGRGSRRVLVLAWCGVGVAFAIASGPGVWQLGREYVASTATADPASSYTLADALDRWWEAGGKPAGAKILTLLGVVFAFSHPRTRCVALTALFLGVFYVLLAVVADPVSRWLATPFYQLPARILYLQVFVVPPLMVLPLLSLRNLLHAHRRSRTVASGLTWTLAGLVILSALPGVVRNYRNMAASVPFGPEAHWIASRIPELVAPEERVANLWDDGSTWAMHVSGRRFLQPCSWELFDGQGSLRPRIAGLFDDPWPRRTLELRALGVQYLWVSDVVWPRQHAEFTRTRLDGDERFEAVLRGEDVTLYRIDWNRGSPDEDPTKDDPH